MDHVAHQETERERAEWLRLFAANIEANNWACVVPITAQVLTRLQALVPHRPDLHAELELEFNIPLLEQMQRNNALVPADVAHYVSSMYDWVERFGAPVDDADTAHASAGLRARLAEGLATAVPAAVLDVHDRIDRIIRLTGGAIRVDGTGRPQENVA